MSDFVENPSDFSAECQRQNGRCEIVRENILFLNDGNQLAAVNHLQWKCGHIVIVPSGSSEGEALLFHTSCQRMTDVIGQIFPDCLNEPERFAQGTSEQSLGEILRRRLTISFDDCRSRVEQFVF